MKGFVKLFGFTGRGCMDLEFQDSGGTDRKVVYLKTVWPTSKTPSQKIKPTVPYVGQITKTCVHYLPT